MTELEIMWATFNIALKAGDLAAAVIFLCGRRDVRP